MLTERACVGEWEENRGEREREGEGERERERSRERDRERERERYHQQLYLVRRYLSLHLLSK